MANTVYVANDEMQEDVVDVSHVFRALWKKLPIILLVGLLCGALAFAYSYFLITPLYQTSFTVYVNNKTDTGEKNNGISNQDLNAARSLATTYAEIITGRTVLETAANNCGITYKYGTLKGMVNTNISNNTEIIRVNVKAKSPEMALSLANAVIETSTEQISSIIDGSSMSVVDKPYLPEGKASPSYLKFTLIGMVAGMVLVIIIVVIRAIVDDRILDESSIEDRLGVPVLGTIPNLAEASKNKDAYAGYRASTPKKGNG